MKPVVSALGFFCLIFLLHSCTGVPSREKIKENDVPKPPIVEEESKKSKSNPIVETPKKSESVSQVSEPKKPEPVVLAEKPKEPEPIPVVEKPAKPEPSVENPKVPEPAPPVLEPEKPQYKPVIEEIKQPSSAPDFDPNSISAEYKKTTMSDIQKTIEDLNKIIEQKQYKLWVSYLTPEYIDTYSNTDYLSTISESAVLRAYGIKLESLLDYFTHVVYPSRKQDRLDDIEFASEDSIKAITVSLKGERLVLYYLEKRENTWKIGIGR